MQISGNFTLFASENNFFLPPDIHISTLWSIINPGFNFTTNKLTILEDWTAEETSIFDGWIQVLNNSSK